LLLPNAPPDFSDIANTLCTTMETENISSPSSLDDEFDHFPHHHYHRDTPPHSSYTPRLTPVTTSPTSFPHHTLPRPRLSSPNDIPVADTITQITRRSTDVTWTGRYDPIGRFVDQAASARLGRVFPPLTSEPLIQIGRERYVVIDQVGEVDIPDRGTEPAFADQAVPQAIAPDHSYHLGPPPRA